MSFNAEVLRVLIASPSDVKVERDKVEEAISLWNKRFSEELEVVLLPGRWEEDVVPTYRGEDPQRIINEQLVGKCDILIGIFWTKLGTATLSHSSGTLEEINIFIERGKEVMLYFLEKDIPRNTDFSQLQLVDEFKREYGKRGIYSSFDEEKIIEHLYRKVIEHKKKLNSEQKVNPTFSTSEMVAAGSQTTSKVGLSLLVNSGRLTFNEILLLGYILDTGNRQFGTRWMTDQTLEVIKKWESNNFLSDELSTNYNDVVFNLAERGLLEPKETTSYGNVRLFAMPLSVYDELRCLPNEVEEKIRKIVKDQRLPF